MSMFDPKQQTHWFWFVCKYIYENVSLKNNETKQRNKETLRWTARWEGSAQEHKRSAGSFHCVRHGRTTCSTIVMYSDQRIINDVVPKISYCWFRKYRQTTRRRGGVHCEWKVTREITLTCMNVKSCARA